MDTLTAQGLWQKNVDLSALTSTRTGGCCDFFHAPMTIEALLEDLERARSLSIPVTVLGCMSNVLVSDRGIAGLVISTRAVKGIEIKGDLVIAACGERLDAVINKALDHNLAGLEELGGIPGTVGGATWGNAGANGLEVGDRFFYSDYITASGKLRRMPSYCDAFSYRSSPFEEGDTILCTAFRLQPLGATAQARVRKEAFKAKRIERGQFKYPCAGCFFRNPPGMSAGALIDEAGLKGLEHGGAMVSPYHGAFIVNASNATSRDMYELAEIVRAAVEKRYGITLEYEVRLLGDF